MSGRTKLLGVVMLVLVVLVAGGRFLRGGEGGEAEVEGDASARARYVGLAGLVGAKRRLIESEGAYASALAETRRKWDSVRERLVAAPSAELAEAQFRDEVLEFVRRRDITGARTSRVESRAIGKDERLRLLEVRLEFETPSMGDVYRLIDELENVRGTLTRVSSVDLGGPGRLQRRKEVAATLTIEAIAYVEGSG